MLLLVATKGPGFLRRNVHHPPGLVVWCPIPTQRGEVAFHECPSGDGVSFQIFLEEDISVLFFMFLYRIHVETGCS